MLSAAGAGKVRFGGAPKPAREARALPGICAMRSLPSAPFGRHTLPPNDSSPVSFSIEVIVTSAMPHGVMASKGERSPLTLSAKPCIVIQCRTPTPIEAILRCSTQTPVRPARVVALISKEASRIDQKRFDPAQVAMQILPMAAQVEEKITDQLSGAVISRLSAAIDRDQRMREMRARRADSIDPGCGRWCKPDRARAAKARPAVSGLRAFLPNEVFLPRERIGESDSAEPACFQRRRSYPGGGRQTNPHTFLCAQVRQAQWRARRPHRVPAFPLG